MTGCLVPPFAALVILLATLGALAHAAASGPEPGGVRAAFVVALAVFTSGLVAARARRAPRLLLLLGPFLVLALLVSGVELDGRVRAARQVSWGDVFGAGLAAPSAFGPGGRFKPGLSVRMRSNEHPYAGARFVTEEHGFRNERTVPLVAPGGERRLLNVGDSFSLGFELGQDEFLGARVERELGVPVINACIEDPAHGLDWLERWGLQYSPSVVLLGICGNDPMQTEEFLGPTRRFVLAADGTVEENPRSVPADPLAESRELTYPAPAAFRAAYLGEPARSSPLAFLGDFQLTRLLASPNHASPSILYSYCYEEELRGGHKRLLDGVSNLAYFYRKPLDKVAETYDRLTSVLHVMRDRCAAHGARLAVVLFPEKFQVDPAEWDAMCEFWSLADEDFDLDLAPRRLREVCSREGIECVDLGPELRRVARAGGGTLYFPHGDMHLNVRGVAIAASAVAARLAPLLR